MADAGRWRGGEAPPVAPALDTRANTWHRRRLVWMAGLFFVVLLAGSATVHGLAVRADQNIMSVQSEIEDVIAAESWAQQNENMVLAHSLLDPLASEDWQQSLTEYPGADSTPVRHRLWRGGARHRGCGTERRFGASHRPGGGSAGALAGSTVPAGPLLPADGRWLVAHGATEDSFGEIHARRRQRTSALSTTSETNRRWKR